MFLDPDTARLRLDDADLDRLIEWALPGVDATAPLTGFTADLLERSGVTEGGQPSALFAPTLQALSMPWAEVQLTLVSPNATARHLLWLAPRTAAVAVRTNPNSFELSAVPPASVPAVVAELVGLGPRGRPDNSGTLEVPSDILRGLFDTQEAESTSSGANELVPHLPPGELRDCLERGAWRTVLVEVDWRHELGAVSPRWLSYLDTDGGLVDVQVGPERAMLKPTDPSSVWSSLIVLTRPPQDIDLSSEYARRTLHPDRLAVN